MKRVSRVIEKTKGMSPSAKRPNSLLSQNKVVGYSVNFPIHRTCKPTKVCIETCYYAVGTTTWNRSLRKQLWIYEYCVNDPISFAEEVVSEYHKKGLKYLRWNGGGDLFLESTIALNYIGENYPDVVLWVVSRIPDMVGLLEDYPNIHLHFSLDKHSLDRREKVLDLAKRPIFFSYQCMKEEKPDVEDLVNNHGVSLFFFDNYYLTDSIYEEQFLDFLCPLNLDRTNEGDISGSCEKCSRCFNGHWLAKTKMNKP